MTDDPYEAATQYPLGAGSRVAIDPRHRFGQARDEETGVPTWVLFDMVRAGHRINTVAEWYEIPREAVVQAVEFELVKGGDKDMARIERESTEAAKGFWARKTTPHEVLPRDG